MDQTVRFLLFEYGYAILCLDQMNESYFSSFDTFLCFIFNTFFWLKSQRRILIKFIKCIKVWRKSQLLCYIYVQYMMIK